MTFTIKATKRAKGEGEAVRALGQIPAVVYGPEIKSMALSIEAREFDKLYNLAGESSLIDCVIEGEKEPIKVLIQDVQNDPLKNRVLHVDFRQVKMGEEMTATIELELVGVPNAVKSLGGTLIKGHDAVNVKCLPKDLVGSIQVDLSVLKTFDDVIHVKDIVLPAGIVITDDPDGVIAKVTPPLTDDQIKAMEEEGAKGIEAVEVVAEKKEEGDEKAEEGEKKEEGKKEK